MKKSHSLHGFFVFIETLIYCLGCHCDREAQPWREAIRRTLRASCKRAWQSPRLYTIQIRSLPSQLEVAMWLSAIAKIKINQALIRYTLVFSQFFEIRNGIFIQPDSNLLFEPVCIRIRLWFRKVVMFTHDGIPHKVFVPAYLLCGRKWFEWNHSF